MQFIELTGKTLGVLLHDDKEQMAALTKAGVKDDTLLRINEQGDIEIRRPDQWDVIGGLLGDYVHRLQGVTGLNWAE
ncbi:hypothetical protein [Lignipirellula cremea]|uniref:Uncharacterized protein n=1 Tax=Lignipirellula cremea TaxID=2528010 RepID=A0A518E1H1_9BACT|nr:hypothetical protein [Lignipirellula cremea]QDU97911.1 hypothetical protein Pla8534_57700 [Lignipirellula cremea]